MKTQKQPKYKFSETLFDAFYNYENSNYLWEKYWGYNEAPSITQEEYNKQQFDTLINEINKTSINNIELDRTIAFKEIIDCINQKRTSELFEVKRVFADGVIGGKNDYETTKSIIGFQVCYHNNYFFYSKDLCSEFCNYFKGSISNKRFESVLSTTRGNIIIYGFIDKLMPFSIHSIKLAHSYNVGKYKNKFQHLIYPFLVLSNGIEVRNFEYNIAVLDKTNMLIDSYTETYVFDDNKDMEKLTEYSEHLVDFIEDNKSLITNEEIFNI